MNEQMEMDLFHRPIDFLDCEEYCTSDECNACVLCDHYKGSRRAEIMASVNEYKEILKKVF